MLTSSRASACLNTLIVVFTVTKGKLRLMRNPMLATVSLSDNKREQLSQRGHLGTYQTPTNSMGTSRQKVRLNPGAIISVSDFFVDL
jgi:hypothetical protein